MAECLLEKASLQNIVWNYDLEIDGEVAVHFLKNVKCQNVKMTGVFQSRITRSELKKPNFILFEPEFSGDDSADNDQPNAWEREVKDEEMVSSGSDQFSEDEDPKGYKLEEMKVEVFEMEEESPKSSPKSSPKNSPPKVEVKEEEDKKEATPERAVSSGGSEGSEDTPKRLRRVLRAMQVRVNQYASDVGIPGDPLLSPRGSSAKKKKRVSFIKN